MELVFLECKRGWWPRKRSVKERARDRWNECV